MNWLIPKDKTIDIEKLRKDLIGKEVPIIIEDIPEIRGEDFNEIDTVDKNIDEVVDLDEKIEEDD